MYSRINLQLFIIRWLELYFYAVIKHHGNHTATIDLRQHNKLNEITNRKIGDDTKVLFAYDGTTGASNGNLANDGTLQLSYDALNRLIQVKRKSDGATIVQYVYDALNRRTRKTISNGGLTEDVPNGTIDYLYQNWQVVEERSGSTVNKQYVWGQYIDECVQLKTLTTTGPQSLPAGDYYPLQDLLYRTTALTDGSGPIVGTYDYDAYGNTLIFSIAGAEDNWWADDAAQANYGACDVLYCGYRYDPESKQYQVRNREYNPVLGRWLQRDPIGFEGGDWNLYGYVGNNPTNLFAPYGLMTKTECIALRASILLRAGTLLGWIAKYDPVEDAKGGFIYNVKVIFGKEVPKHTKPGGHYKKIIDLQTALRKDIARYWRECRDCNDGPKGPPLPRLHEVYNYIPEPVYDNPLQNAFVNSPGSKEAWETAGAVAGGIAVGAAAGAIIVGTGGLSAPALAPLVAM